MCLTSARKLAPTLGANRTPCRNTSVCGLSRQGLGMRIRTAWRKGCTIAHPPIHICFNFKLHAVPYYGAQESRSNPDGWQRTLNFGSRVLWSFDLKTAGSQSFRVRGVSPRLQRFELALPDSMPNGSEVLEGLYYMETKYWGLGCPCAGIGSLKYL